MTIKGIFATAQKFVTDNSPAVLTGLAVAGTVTTAVLTGKAAYSAALKIHVENERCVTDGQGYMESRQKLELVWKEFIPAAVTGAATVTCIITANRIGTRRAAAIAAAFKLSEQLAEEYKERVVKTLGAQKEETMRAELAGDRMRRDGGAETVIIIGSEVVFYDELSGRFFKNEVEKINKAINEINFQINAYYHASLSDFYEKIGLSRTTFSDSVGWNSDELLDVKITATQLDDGRPALSMAFRTTPINGYDRLH